MFQRVRKHINPASTIAFVALVFAITGGAFAATGGGSPPHATMTATAVNSKAKAKTGPRGPAGPKGAAGATGPAGPTGPTGSAGAAGAKGENGSQGGPGSQGEKGEPGPKGPKGTSGASVTSTEFVGEKKGEDATCKEGGNEVKAGAAGAVTYVCNGKEGSPWTDGGTLPPKATETGSWTTTGLTPVGEGNETYPEISFPIPLGGGKEGVAKNINTHFLKEGETGATGSGCAGGSAETPTAEPGNLCIYAATLEHAAPVILPSGRPQFINPEYNSEVSRAGLTGAFLVLQVEPGATPYGFGTWAVTEQEAA